MYHEELFFRDHLSSAAISHAYRTVHKDVDAHLHSHFHELHGHALFYFMAIRELQGLGVHRSIVLENELCDEHLELYEFHCLASLFPHSDRKKVTSLVIDGHQKLKNAMLRGSFQESRTPPQVRIHCGKLYQRVDDGV